jgi:EAL domain-containing protein (putative c-di-GMP-specific phosphodiesterase class I)
MREKLRPNDILGRLGGDEFGVLLAGVSTVEAAAQAAERLRRNLEGHTFVWEQRTYTTSASIGAVMLSRASTLKELFAHADAACYLAKEGGRNRVHFYSEDDAAITTRLSEMEWASRIADALREGRLLLDYQELHAIRPSPDEKPHIELLLRLRAEDGREVMPGAFLPAAERYGLMPAIDRWVVETALTHIDELHPSGGRLGSCNINLSSASLEDAGIFTRIEELVRTCSIDPHRLIFEITETVAIQDIDDIRGFVTRLKNFGSRIAIDDFGAGYTSFRNLRKLGVDIVKIDGAFVQNIARSADDRAFVQTLIDLARRLQIKTVAEWVQDEESAVRLREWGCDYIQGRLIGLASPERPWNVPAEAVLPAAG